MDEHLALILSQSRRDLRADTHDTQFDTLLVILTIAVPIVGRAPKPQPTAWEYKVQGVADLEFDDQMGKLGAGVRRQVLFPINDNYFSL
ncbi:MAG: hypothetical protein ACYCW6_27820, partial [Candidatus Xenobia bacterium]